MKTVSQDHFVQRNLIFAGPGESYLIGRVHRDAQGASRQSAPTGYARRWPTGKRLEACVA